MYKFNYNKNDKHAYALLRYKDKFKKKFQKKLVCLITLH